MFVEEPLVRDRIPPFTTFVSYSEDLIAGEFNATFINADERERAQYLVELFVKNLFDEDKWAGGARWADFGSPFQGAFLTAKQGVAVTPLDKREVGVRVTYRFGE